ncbi:MAG: hypothetical protein H0U28_16355 [Nocardioidaceae bacterium]|nr:hypothetical protein [Nocardioidaceae bacterium]
MSNAQFDYYPVGSFAIKAAAEETRGRVGAVRAVVSQLESDHRQAVGAVEGTLQDSLRDAPTEAVTRSSEVGRTAEYAAGCLELFSVAIDDYNFNRANPRSISKLNLEYSTAVSNGFGLEPLPDDATDRQVDEYSDDMVGASNAKIRELTWEKHRLDGWLDGEAGDIRNMLGRGPNDADLQTLWSSGMLPPYAPILYAGSQFSAGDLPADARQELTQYLIDHPDVLLDPPAALAALIAGLPVDVRTDIHVERRMEQLRREGLLSGPNPGGIYANWIRNTVENGVSVYTVIDIARDHDIRPDDFDVLDGLQEITDPDGKSFFVLDTDMSGDAARVAVLMTYILNAGTDYENGDFASTPYGSAEVQRIKDRQADNAWFSYDRDVGFVHGNGGRLVTTPNGMLMGLGGNEIQDVFSQAGGSTWGEIFMINEEDVENFEERLDDIITQGIAPNSSSLDLDRLLHHEEIHSQQWAEYGYLDYIARYADASTDVVWEWGPGWTGLVGHWEIQQVDGEDNEYEVDACLEDGGY